MHIETTHVSATPARSHRARQHFWTSALFYAPALVLYVPFFIIPAFLSFGYSFTSWNGMQFKANIVYLDNYIELMQDERFWEALKNTAFYTVALVVANTFIAMVIAVFLDNMRRMRGLVRSMFFYPSVLSVVAVGALFTYCFNYYDGLFNHIFDFLRLGILKQDWLGDPHLVLWGVSLLTIWSMMGYYIVIYLAGLQTIPSELYECSKIDGAGPLHIFFHITVPMLAPATTVCASSALFGAMSIFAQILVTTNGGPGYSSMSVSFFVYWLSVQVNRQGYATAAATVLFLLIMLVTQCVTLYLRGREAEV